MIFVMWNKNCDGISTHGFLWNKQSRQNINLQMEGLTYLFILEVAYFIFFFFLILFIFPDSNELLYFLGNSDIIIAVYALNTVCFKNGTNLSAKNLILGTMNIRKMYAYNWC